MRDLFTRLAERELGTAASLEPLIPSAYAVPDGGREAVEREAAPAPAETDGAPAKPSARRPPQAETGQAAVEPHVSSPVPDVGEVKPVPGGPVRPAGVPAGEPEVGTAAASPPMAPASSEPARDGQVVERSGPQPAADGPRVEPAAQEPVRESARRAAVGPADAIAPAARSGPSFGDDGGPAGQRPAAPTAVTPAAAGPRPTASRPGPEPVAAGLPRRARVATGSVEPAPRPLPAAGPGQPETSAAAPMESPAPPPRPVESRRTAGGTGTRVEINIGRIEVRAILPEAPAAPPPEPAPRAATLSLDDYLERRDADGP